jgi:hypothetical protein
MVNLIQIKTDDDLIGCLELTEDFIINGSIPHTTDDVQWLKALYAEAKKRMPDYVSPYESEHCFFK